jgi:CheY-like chemotaxis protein
MLNINRNRIVLLIDDDDDDRSLFEDAVKEIDSTIKFMSASDGQDALRILKSATILPDYIFLDLNMPRLGGKQCLAEIKKNPRLVNIPVIIYTTTRRKEDVEETKKLGALHFITKPTLFNEICEAIVSVLNPENKTAALK